MIPTDFSVPSLQLVEYAILNYPNTLLDIVLVHGYRPPTTKWEAINFSPIREINKLSGESFCRAKNQLCREHKGELGNLRVELFTGHNSMAFKNFMEQHQLEEAVVPANRFLMCSGTRSFDVTPLIKKNMPQVVEISMPGSGGQERRPRFSFLGFLQ